MNFKEVGLTQEEFEIIQKQLGRNPNDLELGLFGVLWSEHCSYKSSKSVLSWLPHTGRAVVQGPGENAGVVELNDEIHVAFKVESHNHPSYVEPGKMIIPTFIVLSPQCHTSPILDWPTIFLPFDGRSLLLRSCFPH